jgi:hypothetical protein
MKRRNAPKVEKQLVWELSRDWRSGAWLKANGLSLSGYIPDAAELDYGRIDTAHEYGGFYDVERLEEIWRASRDTPSPPPGSPVEHMNYTPVAIW